MTQEFCPVQHVQQVADNVFVLTFSSEEISESIQPGQFINIKVNEGTEPLLRRPFSVYRTDRKQVQIIFNVIGKGTAALRKKNKDDWHYEQLVEIRNFLAKEKFNRKDNSIKKLMKEIKKKVNTWRL